MRDPVEECVVHSKPTGEATTYLDEAGHTIKRLPAGYADGIDPRFTAKPKVRGKREE